jgi:carbonic anhydrase/acetyltransferase-like protein (isoleucine patch superfamily)
VPLYGYRGKRPTVAPDAFIAPTAVLIGDVTVRSGASVWFGSVLRGDMDRIEIGEGSNVQDNCTIHTDTGEPTIIGPECTIGHGAIVHSSIVVPERFAAPPRSLVLGIPARVVREVRPEDDRWTVGAAQHYAELSAWYRENLRETE